MSLMERLFRVDRSCSRCGGTTIDALQRQGLRDAFLAIWRLNPYHCRRCYGKFYIIDPENRPAPPYIHGNIAGKT